MFVLANQTLKVYGTGMFTILPGAMNRHDYPLDSTGVVLRSYGYPYSQLTMRSQGSANRVPNAVIHQGSFGCEILAYIGMSCFVSLYHPWAFGFANGWRFDEDWAHMVMLHDFAAFCSIFLLGMVRSVSPRRNVIQRTVQRRLGRSGWHRVEDEPYINGSRWILWVSDWGIFWLHTS